MSNEHDPICPACGMSWSGHEGATVLCRKVQEMEAEIDRLQSELADMKHMIGTDQYELGYQAGIVRGRAEVAAEFERIAHQMQRAKGLDKEVSDD